MQLSRFVQVLLLRDVLMYIFPGSIFGMLLCLIGFDQYIASYTYYIFNNFGEFLGATILLAISYSLGYFLYIFTTAVVRWIFKIPSNKEPRLVKKNSSKKEHNLSFDTIENDLVSKVSQFAGKNLIAGWSGLLREEVGLDQRGLRYIRYLCEMEVMEKYPEIHYITIERRSSLKNFQTSLSGALMVAGTIGLINAAVGNLTSLPDRKIEAVLGSAMIFLAILLFKSLEKMEQELRISIWRAFHAMSLIKETQQVEASPNDLAKETTLT